MDKEADISIKILNDKDRRKLVMRVPTDIGLGVNQIPGIPQGTHQFTLHEFDKDATNVDIMRHLGIMFDRLSMVFGR